MTNEPEIVPDTQYRGLVGALPPYPRALALLARFDRPIGWQLLFWPGAWGVALAKAWRSIALGSDPVARAGQHRDARRGMRL